MKSNHDLTSLGFATKAIHVGQSPDPLTGAVMVPVYQTSTFAQKSPGEHTGYEYARTGNPTRTAYEACLASLEDAKYGLAFSSGLAATDAILHTLSQGDHVICSDDVYGGTFRIFDKVYRKLGIEFTYVDFTKPEKISAAFKPTTRLVWIETPTNPTLKISSISRVSALAKSHGALTVVDNTFMSPFFQQPLKHGADLVLHSATKYLNGHSDVVGGAILTSHTEMYERLKFLQNAVGAIPGPWDCFLIMRGLKTLPLRMERHQQNALKIAEFLSSHPSIKEVRYPGLESHPQHGVAKEQMSGFGGMMTVWLKGGLAESRRFLENVRIFTLAESLGGVESLIEHPAIMTHASIPEATRRELGIQDSMVRLSIGIESAQDLIDDLKWGLKGI